MSGRTITKADLLETIYIGNPGLTRAQARDVFELTIEVVSSALVRGETVNIRSFGSFATRMKRERVGRNPRTGVEAPITPRRVLTFKASPRLVREINGLAGGDADTDE